MYSTVNVLGYTEFLSKVKVKNDAGRVLIEQAFRKLLQAVFDKGIPIRNSTIKD